MSLGAVLICKEYSEAYNNAFSKRGLNPHFLQVLESRPVNQDLLKRTILAGPGTKYGAVIITSSRAANAWVMCLKEALAEQSGLTADSWQDIIFYVVGKATATALRTSDELVSTPFTILGAETTGSGEKLARLIIEAHSRSSELEERRNGRRGVLYLTGDKNRETIPEIISNAGLQYHKMKVYETFAASELSTRLAQTVLRMQRESCGAPDDALWLVLFSPSTSVYVLEAWRDVCQVEPALRDCAFRLAAIGPTTEAYLMGHGHKVAVTSTNPDAESLAEAIYSSISLPDSILTS